VLNDPSGTTLSFAGSIGGFGGSDTIDLTTFADSGNPSRVWNQSAGTLTITDGSKSIVLHLTGTYTTANFVIGADTNGGTVISYAASTPSAVTANAAGPAAALTVPSQLPSTLPATPAVSHPSVQAPNLAELVHTAPSEVGRGALFDFTPHAIGAASPVHDLGAPWLLAGIAHHGIAASGDFRRAAPTHAALTPVTKRSTSSLRPVA
jgi:hypothetical protein